MAMTEKLPLFWLWRKVESFVEIATLARNEEERARTAAEEVDLRRRAEWDTGLGGRGLREEPFKLQTAEDDIFITAIICFQWNTTELDNQLEVEFGVLWNQLQLILK